jgi:hypothetical protein
MEPTETEGGLPLDLPAASSLDAALSTLGLPGMELSALVVFGVAALVVRLNQDLKMMAPRGEKDTLAWQALWTALPFVEGALFGLLAATLGKVSYPAGAVLGLIGGGFAVPLWHLLRARMPRLFGGGRG